MHSWLLISVRNSCYIIIFYQLFLLVEYPSNSSLGCYGHTNLICIFSTMYAASLQTIGSFAAWRVAFLGGAVLAAAVAVLNFTTAVDPRSIMMEARHATAASTLHSTTTPTLPSFKGSVGILHREITALMHVPSFLLTVGQGIFGNFPWAALVYLTLYFQLLQFSAFTASLLVALFMAGVAAGGLLGGILGDAAAVRWPHHGRIYVAQVSVASGIPCAFVLTRGLFSSDGRPSSAAAYALFLIVFGLIKAWPAPACNNPLFAEIVHPERRSLLYAFDRCFETALAAAQHP